MATVKLPGLEGHDWIDFREVARIIGVRPQSVTTYVARGQLTPHKFGNSNVFDLKEVERFAATRRGRGRPPKAAKKKR